MCIFCHYLALERVDKACTEVIIVVCGYLRVGAACTNSRNFVFFNYIAGSHRKGRTVRTNQHAYFILFNKACRNGCSFCFIGFVVSYNQFNFFAQNFGMQLICKFNAAQFQFAAGGIIACQR